MNLFRFCITNMQYAIDLVEPEGKKINKNTHVYLTGISIEFFERPPVLKRSVAKKRKNIGTR